MATDPKKAKATESTKDKGDDAEGSEQSAESSGKKKKLFIIVGIAILLMAISIGGTLLAVKLLSSDSKNHTEKSADEDNDEADESEDEEEVAEHEKVNAVPAIYFTMQPNFTVNFNVDGRQRYLQAEITLLYRNPELESLLKLHMPAIRNQLVMLLSGKSFDELQDPVAREKLKQEALVAVQLILDKEVAILNQANKSEDEQEDKDEENEDQDDVEKLPPMVIEQVLFTRFVMQ